MKQIFINLPVAEVVKSKDFYTQLGFENSARLPGQGLQIRSSVIRMEHPKGRG